MLSIGMANPQTILRLTEDERRLLKALKAKLGREYNVIVGDAIRALAKEHKIK